MYLIQKRYSVNKCWMNGYQIKGFPVCKPAQIPFLYFLYQILLLVNKYTSLASEYRLGLILVCQSQWMGKHGVSMMEKDSYRASQASCWFHREGLSSPTAPQLQAELHQEPDGSTLPVCGQEDSMDLHQYLLLSQPCGVHPTLQPVLDFCPPKTPSFISPNFLTPKTQMSLGLLF